MTIQFRCYYGWDDNCAPVIVSMLTQLAIDRCNWHSVFYLVFMMICLFLRNSCYQLYCFHTSQKVLEFLSHASSQEALWMIWYLCLLHSDLYETKKNVENGRGNRRLIYSNRTMRHELFSTIDMCHFVTDMCHFMTDFTKDMWSLHFQNSSHKLIWRGDNIEPTSEGWNIRDLYQRYLFPYPTLPACFRNKMPANNLNWISWMHHLKIKSCVGYENCWEK